MPKLHREHVLPRGRGDAALGEKPPAVVARSSASSSVHVGATPLPHNQMLGESYRMAVSKLWLSHPREKTIHLEIHFVAMPVLMS